jgi:hypothetical protein
MLAPVTHILPLTNIRRTRVLPVTGGRVTVRAGQKVSAADVIADASVPSRHILLDIRRGLGGIPASAADKAIVRQEGEKLTKDDVIAEADGMFSRIVRAPVDGEIVSIHGGQVLLRVQSTLIELKAGMSGTVVEILPERGAVIEANGALVQAVWGNGRVDSGLLLVLAKQPDEELTRARIDVSMRGAVVLAGTCATTDALQAAAELPLRGLILASMASELVPVANQLAYPILILEGFGHIPMSSNVYQLLSTSEKRDVSVNATLNASTGERPELVIPLPATGQSTPETDYFAANQVVRILGEPYQGEIGKIIQVRQGLATLPNGIRALAADVQLDSDTRVLVPLANLDVLE